MNILIKQHKNIKKDLYQKASNIIDVNFIQMYCPSPLFFPLKKKTFFAQFLQCVAQNPSPRQTHIISKYLRILLL